MDNIIITNPLVPIKIREEFFNEKRAELAAFRLVKDAALTEYRKLLLWTEGVIIKGNRMKNLWKKYSTYMHSPQWRDYFIVNTDIHNFILTTPFKIFSYQWICAFRKYLLWETVEEADIPLEDWLVSTSWLYTYRKRVIEFLEYFTNITDVHESYKEMIFSEFPDLNKNLTKVVKDEQLSRYYDFVVTTLNKKEPLLKKVNQIFQDEKIFIIRIPKSSNIQIYTLMLESQLLSDIASERVISNLAYNT